MTKSPSSKALLKDLFLLTKPKITLMTILLALAGFLHAAKPVTFSALSQVLFSLLAIALLVSGSSALNMYLERNFDGLMERTKNRPLPAGRLKPEWAILVGALCSTSALLIFLSKSNLFTALCAIIALILYVFAYTPMKRISWTSLLLGSFPGAMPVVLGYLSHSGALDDKALALFAWAFLWQVPHFLAISLFREQEYSTAGFPVMSRSFGVSFTKYSILFSSWLLVLSSFAMYVAQIIDKKILVIALFIGAYFLWQCHKGFSNKNCDEWAKNAFKASLVYQSLLFILLVIAAFA
jgi:protoheme IX farnesyltransferase